MSLFIQDTDDFDELDDSGFAFEYRGDNFDSYMTGFVGADASVVLGNPTFRQLGDLFACRVVAADSDVIAPGAGCFNFYTEGKLLGYAVGVCCVAFDCGHGFVLPALIDRALVAMNRLQDVSVRIESRPAVNLVALGLLSDS